MITETAVKLVALFMSIELLNKEGLTRMSNKVVHYGMEKKVKQKLKG